MATPGGSDGKESACNAQDPGSIPGLGRSPGEENDCPLQYSCLENSMDRGTWRATVHGVTKSWTWQLTHGYTSSRHLPSYNPTESRKKEEPHQILATLLLIKEEKFHRTPPPQHLFTFHWPEVSQCYKPPAKENAMTMTDCISLGSPEKWNQ